MVQAMSTYALLTQISGYQVCHKMSTPTLQIHIDDVLLQQFSVNVINSTMQRTELSLYTNRNVTVNFKPLTTGTSKQELV